MRLSKTVGSTTTKYYYVGSQLVEMTQGSDKLHFTYDATGASAVTYGNATYYYLKNAQGDILGIVNTSGTVVVSYTYDAWGNVLSVTGSMASTLGALNPLRYRGYVYDTETSLYYLLSRYYDPSVGRFICADILTDTKQGTLGTNMFAYCNNNPVSNKDVTGAFLNTVFGAIAGGIVAMATRDEKEDRGSAFWRGFATGAVAGAGLDLCIVSGGTIGFVAAAVFGAGSAVWDTLWEANNNGEKATVGDCVVNGILGAGFNMLFGVIGRPLNAPIRTGFREIMGAMIDETVKGFTNRSGQFLLKRSLHTVAESMFGSSVQALMGKLYSIALTQ